MRYSSLPFVRSAGADIYWNAEGTGPPVLLIMGLSYSSLMWFRTAPALTKSFRIIVLDNRGMGRSSVPRGFYSIRQMADDAKAVIDAAGEQSVHVVGASMGGMIAQELALRHPKAVRSLVLGCTSWSGARGKWPDLRSLGARTIWKARSLAGFQYAMLALLYSSQTPRERIEEDLEVCRQSPWTVAGFAGQMAAILRWSAGRRLHQIQVPTLVVHGNEDRLIPLANGKRLADRIPNARFGLIPNAGHMLTTDRPELCNAALLQFLHEQEEQVLQSASGIDYDSI